MSRFPVSLLLLLFALTVSASGADEDVTTAQEKLERGRYRSAARDLEEILDATPGNLDARLARARLRLETGEYDGAEEDLDAILAADAGPRATAEDLRLDLLLIRGRADEVVATAEDILKRRADAVHPVLAMGRAHRMRGRRDEAREAFRSLLTRYNRAPFESPRDRLDVARATIQLAELAEQTRVNLSPTMKLMDRLTRDDPTFVEAFVAKGDLLVKWQKDVDARKEYRKALKVNSKHARALLGMAESYAFRMDLGRAVRYARRAAETNPNLVPVLCFEAGVKVSDYEYDQARELLDRARSIDPHSDEARALLGAMAYVTGDRATFDRLAEEALAYDPSDGTYFHVLAQILENHRRFEEAARWARRGWEVDPLDWGAAFTLGRNLLNIGDDEAAYEVLDKAERLDPYPHIWRANYLELFDAALSKFIDTNTDHFRIRIHAGESRVLRDLMSEVMEDAYRTLGEKYGHFPKPPVLIEVFHVHDDFAARTVGMPGLGALGACFGRVITLDSPSARPAGAFAWAATAWHEFAHSITLGLSRGRVPRWFTEGLSVYEERCLAPHYERRMERDLFDAYHNDALPEIAHFNAEFRGPRVMFAYYLGGLMCEYIVETHGFDSIPEMLKLYGEDARDEKVFREALGVSLSEFDAGFREWVKTTIAPWKLRPRWGNEALQRFRLAVAKNEDDFESWISLAEAYVQRGNTVDAGMALDRARKLRPDDPRVWLVRGHLALRARLHAKADEAFRKALAMPGGEDHDARLAVARLKKLDGDLEGARADFEKAKEDFPFGVGAGNPYAELAAIHEAEGRVKEMLAEKRAYANLVETEIETRVELAKWAEQEGDLEQAARYLEELLLLYPLNPETNLRHARVVRQLKRWDRAAMLYRMVLELAPEHPERASIHAELAETEHMRGRVSEARIHAQRALELDPENAGAKEILEKVN